MMVTEHTPGPWEYVPSTANHGPYVSNGWGAGDICDCYTMSKPSELAVCNGGTSQPIPFQHEEADANARLIAAAPEMLDALEQAQEWLSKWGSAEPQLAVIEAAIAKATGGAS